VSLPAGLEALRNRFKLTLTEAELAQMEMWDSMHGCLIQLMVFYPLEQIWANKNAQEVWETDLVGYQSMSMDNWSDAHTERMRKVQDRIDNGELEEGNHRIFPKGKPKSFFYRVCRLLSAVCCLLSAVCCLLSAVCCLLSAVCCLLSTVCCLLSAVCCLLSAFCCLISAVCCLLSVVCCVLSADFC
jgi:hypothetical protein